MLFELLPRPMESLGGSKEGIKLFRNFSAIAIVFRYEAAMGEKRTDLLRGTLDLLILKALSLEPLHGVAISRRITQITQGAFQVSFGSLFPSLHRMEERAWVEAEWRASENNRRAKYYRLTSSGRAQLKAEERQWNQVVKIMAAAVESV
jgi:PadR family transcriptional regulator PadR